MWSPPWGSTAPFRPDYMPRSPENPRAAAWYVRDDFLFQRRSDRIQSPSISRFDTIKGAGGAIFTRFYPNWSKLSDGEKKSIFDERKWINIKGGGRRKYFNKKKQSRAESIKSKKKAAQEIQHDISSLKSKCKELEEKMCASEEVDEHQDNAGDQFGGSKGKNQQKRSDWLIGTLLLHWVKVIN